MNKVGILTFSDVENYGAVLQAFALQKTIQELGYEVEHIRYVEHKEEGTTNNFSTYYNVLKNNKFQLGHYLKTRSFNHNTSKKFQEFGLKRLNKSRLTAYSMSDLCEQECNYSAIVTGSDMVWSDIGQNLDAFYLQFAPREKRISYAPSITGTEGYSDEMLDKTRERILGIPWLSVREKSGAEFIKSVSGRDAKWVLDPTLLLTRDKWKKYFELEESNCEDYILVYMFQGATNVLDKVNRLAQKHNLKVRYVPMLPSERLLEKNEYGVDGCGPEDFVQLFLNARFVVTNSYHGLLFSLIGEKPFALIHRKSKNIWKSHEGRMASILNLVGLNERYINETDEITDDFLVIDYDRIDNLLQVKRDDSIEYLKIALGETVSNVASCLKQNKEQKQKKYNIESVPVKKCTGCSACYNACPVNAITMEMDLEGFYIPKINYEHCIRCGMCYVSCPTVKMPILSETKGGVVALSKDIISKKSASGGVFATIAKYYIEELKGAVYGAALNSDLKCTHVRANSMEALCPILNSKYVQSQIGDIYRYVKNDLNEGIEVLFSGTPCQIAGLKNYIKDDFDNLLTIEVVCHGVPSPMFWDKEIFNLREKGKFDLRSIVFRNKDNEKINHSAYQFKYLLTDSGKEKEKRCDFWEDPYYNTFVQSASYRYSCYYCNFATEKRVADITIGDCDSWREYPEFLIDKAKSIILVNSKKGQKRLEAVKDLFYFTRLDLVKEREVNVPLTRPTLMPQKRRFIYDDLENMSWAVFSKKYGRRQIVRSKARQILKKVLRGV